MIIYDTNLWFLLAWNHFILIYRYIFIYFMIFVEICKTSPSSYTAAAAAAKSLKSCPTLRSHRRQPTRLPRPWDSSGKNTGVGCHFLLQCMKVKSESEVAQSCLTLRDPMDCSLPGSPIHGIFQARVLEWGAILLNEYWFFHTQFVPKCLKHFIERHKMRDI